jgi:hypothetical protein
VWAESVARKPYTTSAKERTSTSKRLLNC